MSRMVKVPEKAAKVSEKKAPEKAVKASERKTLEKGVKAQGKTTSATDEEKVRGIKGSRNLVILGIVSTGIAVLATAVSLVIYHNSGDIYLDRSRPGYLPDETEIQTQPDLTYRFSSTGLLTDEVIDEYVKNYQEELDMIDDLPEPFSETPLSDQSLGIPEVKVSEPEPEPTPEPEPVYYWW